jgi:pyruvate,water dikinase
MTATTFEAPGPGGWRRLADHFPRALTAEYQRIYRETCPPGIAAYMERYGVVARTLDVAFVHGHLYIAPVPLAGPRQPRITPPKGLVWLLSRTHPEFRRRTRAARLTLQTRPWRQATEHWFAVERDDWFNRNSQIELIDPSTLSEPALIDHLHSCRRLVTTGYQRHFELHGDDLLPVGLLIARGREWGIDPAVTTAALAGACSTPHAIDMSGWMLITGYDLDGQTWHELGATRATTTRPADSPADLRTHIPPEHHDELDALVSDARDAVRLRDDNGAITAAWPMGLLRRAMLAAGERLFPTDPTLAVDATVDELAALLAGQPSVTADQLAARRRERVLHSALDAPQTLGPEFAIPPLDALPRPLGLMAAAQLATADHTFTARRPVGIGTVSYTGRALVADDPTSALSMLEPGDVIITPATSPSWNTLLVQAGALVTANGGLVSHAAITARDFGIPAVIGDATACQRIRTGSIVTVDPLRATVIAVSE